MGHASIFNRRDFLKTTAASTAGLSLMASGFTRFASARTSATLFPINTAISDQRVVCCNDPAMITGTPSAMSIAGQNAKVDAAILSADMDAMAISLAQANTAADAWATIFQKPSSKSWADVKVAIKANCAEPHCTVRPR